ncbi:MAG: protein kinase, partial [Thermoanaerobaculia bacterium]
MVGQTLSHYKILDKLGAGGMGEVYLAEDTTLKRQVALKVLPPELAASQDRLERFQREAETLAALDHPNIVHIYSVEEADGVRFLTMQLVEGKRLSDLIPKSGMPLERIFKFAIPLADALAAAHEKGVIHRDLKPGNIMVTNDGRVKVLDFGLAKLRPELDPGEATALPTEPLTDEGRILGTVPYMSPEQLEGRELDARTDVFSLGIVLYEMATGERPFRGDSSVSIISSIIRDTPREIDTLRPELPHHLARIIRHSLEKEPQRRYHSALDVRNELEDLKTESASGEVSRMSSPRSRLSRLKLWMTLSAAGLVLAAGLATIYWALRPGGEQEEVPTEPLTGRFSKLTFDPALEQEPSLSPDGRFFVYASDASGNWDIYLQR